VNKHNKTKAPSTVN